MRVRAEFVAKGAVEAVDCRRSAIETVTTVGAQLVELRSMGLGQRIGQALMHGWVLAQLCRLLRVEPCRGAGLVVIGACVVGWGEGVKAHRQLLIDALPVGVGQDMARVAVNPGKPGDCNDDARLFGHFSSHRGGGGLPDFDSAPGQLPVPIVDTTHEQDLISVISDERERGR